MRLYESFRWGSQGSVYPWNIENSLKGSGIAGPQAPLLPSSGTPATLSSIGDPCRDWPSVITLIPGGILDSTQQDEQRTGLKTFEYPDHAIRTPTAARAYSWRFEGCGHRNIPPGEYFPYRVASATLLPTSCLDTAPCIPQPADLSILCRGVELGITSVKRCRGVSTLREEKPFRWTSMSVPIEFTATTERATRISRCRTNYRRREPISWGWGDYATPGPTTY